MKDEEDVRLESLFRLQEIADDGFSDRVVAHVRHKIWIRRWTMPIAILIGASIAAKPLVQLLTLLPTLMSFLPEDFRILPENLVPQVSTLVVGTALAGIMILFIRTLEE